MNKMTFQLHANLAVTHADALMNVSPVLLGDANPPAENGVYALMMKGRIMYIGEAKGNGGLRDRLLFKHLSGDDSHAIQRAFRDAFPDRVKRREHIKRNVSAKWIRITDPSRVALVERLLIDCFDPPWNKK